LAQGWNDDQSPTEKTLMRRHLMRRTTAKTAKDQKTSSRAISREGKDHIHISSTCFYAEKEDKIRRLRTIHATPDREKTSFHRACIRRHSGCWPPPLKIGWMVQGARRDVSFLHPLLWTAATTLRRLHPRKTQNYSYPPSLAVCGNPFTEMIRGRRTWAL
jgi:hypothetical protein